MHEVMMPIDELCGKPSLPIVCKWITQAQSVIIISNFSAGSYRHDCIEVFIISTKVGIISSKG